MNVPTPLSLKVSLWLALNLFLLALLSTGFFALQGGLGWNALVAGPAGARLHALADVVAGEAAAAAPENRNAQLERFSAAYGAEFILLDAAGRKLDGTTPELPHEVRRLVERRPPRMGPGEFADGGMRARDRLLEPDPNRPEGPGPFGEGPGLRGRPGFGPRERGEGRFVLRTTEPAVAYWIGLTIPLNLPQGPPRMGTLLLRVPSFWKLLGVLDVMPFLAVSGVVLGFSILFWLPLVRSLTRALAQLTRATERIAEGHFDTRVPVGRRDEIGQLGESVNRMAARLDTLVGGQKKFLGDVAHELCSPLARLQMATSILEERTPPAGQAAVADVREEVQQMNALVNELLAFTKAGLKPRDLALESVDVAALVEEMLKTEDLVGRVDVKVEPATCVRADRAAFRRALGNLARNAVRYAADGGPIVLSARKDGARVVIAVEDEGPGVPVEALERLGEPFYRPESARTRETGGVGLGLSIVRSSISAMGGEVRFANRTPRGFRAEVRLPAFTPA